MGWLFVCSFVCLWVCLFVSLFVCRFVCLLVSLLVCLFVCLFVCVFVCVFVCLFVCVVCLCVCLFVCLFWNHLCSHFGQLGRQGRGRSARSHFGQQPTGPCVYGACARPMGEVYLSVLERENK